MWKELKGDLNIFIEKVLVFAQEANLDVSHLEIDHAALRFKKTKDVDSLLDELLEASKVISQAIVNGRKIYILKLNEPLVVRKYSITCLELPYPAKEHDYIEDGWEHVEFVIKNSSPETIENDFMELFPNFSKADKEQFKYKVSTPKVDIPEQLKNTTIAIEKYKGLAIKFHCYPIETVVTPSK